MARFVLPRRALLRGLGGVALSLPALEIMLPRRVSAASEGPMRYLYAFGGSSIGTSDDSVTPTGEGQGYDLTRGLQPLGDLGVQDRVSVVTGLTIPWNTGSGIPAGGRAVGFHAHSVCPLICGLRSASEDNEAATGPTSDQIVGNAISGSAPHHSLIYRVQPAYYRGSNGSGGTRGRISARRNPETGALEHIEPIISPRLAYESLFANFVPPDPTEAAAAEFALRRQKSVIDLVRGDTERLLPQLGQVDRVRMERHFDELRDLESRLNLIEPPANSACQQLPEPGDDPAIGTAVENGDTDGYASGGAYSNEELRAEIMIDLIHMAFTCELSYVSALMFTYTQCFMNMQPIAGHASDLHELSHFAVGGGQVMHDAMADGIAWHVKHWANLIAKLSDTIDLDGIPIIDKTAMVLTFEGGWGYDPESGESGRAHSTENMVVLIGGNAGTLNASGGQHLRAEGRHPVEVINTAMQAVGVDEPLGEVEGTFPELLG